MRVLADIAIVLALSACTNTVGGTATVNPRGKSVDGLLVGHRLMESGEYELALKAYLRAAAEKGVTAEVLASIGSANMRLERLGQAETQLRQATEMDPLYVPALNNLGVVLMERDKPGEARVYFQRAFAADSGETDSIKENLKRAIAASERPAYSETEDEPVLYDLINGTEGQAEETLNSL